MKKIFLSVRIIAASIACWNARGRQFDMDEMRGPRNSRGAPMPVISDVGFSLRPRSHPFGLGFGLPDDLVGWHFDRDDFDKFLATDWTQTTTGAATRALTAGDGGLLLLTNSAAANDLVQNQRVAAAFRQVVGKGFVIGARAQVSDAANTNLLLGAIDTSANVFTTQNNGIWFEKVGGVNVVGKVAKAGVVTSTGNIGVMANATAMDFAACYDGDKVHFSINGVIKASVSAANLPNTVDHNLSFAIRNVNAVANTGTIDYVMAARAR